MPGECVLLVNMHTSAEGDGQPARLQRAHRVLVCLLETLWHGIDTWPGKQLLVDIRSGVAPGEKFTVSNADSGNDGAWLD